MDNIKLLEKIKRRSNAALNQTDDLIKDFIEETIEEVKEYLNREDIPLGLEGTIIELIIIKINKLGAEGMSSEIFSGISESYIEDWPKEIKRKLKRYKKLPR